MAEYPQVKPYVEDRTSLHDFTIRSLIAGAGFGVLFGTANAYLGLKVGLTIGTAIPLAVIMVALFRALRGIWPDAGILEWNIGQTTGSASSSLASGIIFTIPALFMWGLVPSVSKGIIEFGLLAMAGGLLGILFMIPLRKYLIIREHRHLPYPEGTAAANVLIAADIGGTRARPVFIGLLIGAVYKLFQGLLRLWPSQIDIHVPILKKAVIGIESTPALLGVGYILGYRIAGIMVAGGLLSWLCIIPLIAHFGENISIYLFPQPMEPPGGPFLISQMDAETIWKNYVRYIGAGAVATAGIMAVIRNLPLMWSSLIASLKGLRSSPGSEAVVERRQKDLKGLVVFTGLGSIIIGLALIPGLIGMGGNIIFRVVASACIAIFAFIFVSVSSRLVGLVGVTSNPTSGMAIVTLLGTATLFFSLGWTDTAGKAAVLTIGTVVCVAASIAGDISQDLKSGYLLGATPARQQTAEIVGAIFSAFFIAAAVYLLGVQYGFGTKEFPAPQATLMKTIIEGLLSANLPWGLVLTGGSMAVVAALLGVPPLAFAVGVYLPLSTMTPVFTGGCLRALVERLSKKRGADGDSQTERGVLLGSGLIAGEGLAGIAIALWAAILGTRPKGLGLIWPGHLGEMVSLLIFLALGYFIVRVSRTERR